MTDKTSMSRLIAWAAAGDADNGRQVRIRRVDGDDGWPLYWSVTVIAAKPADIEIIERSGDGQKGESVPEALAGNVITLLGVVNEVVA